jgi:diguanylate cyclase (GGDEF)-like protein/PAS domain S-box-containing protein
VKRIKKGSSKPHRRVKALSYALIYVVLSGIWILLSGAAVEMFAGYTEIRGDLEIYKGLVFVLITGLALYTLLRAWQSEVTNVNDVDTDENESHPVTVAIKLPIIYSFAVLLIIASGSYVVFEHLKRNELNKIEQNLSAVASLKAEQINGWLKQNANYATAAGSGSYLASSFEEWTQKGSLPKQRMLWVRNRLDTLRQSQTYGELALYDVNGKLFLSTDGKQGSIDKNILPLLQRAVNSRAPVIGGMHWHEKSNGAKYASLGMAAPLLPSGIDGPVAGVLLFEMNPQHYILPIIQTWPTPSESAETILFLHEDDEVVFLNELRHRKDSILTKLNIKENPTSVAAKAIDGNMGFIDGTDYRGMPVFGYVVNIPDTDWVMIAEVAKDEIEQPIWRMAINVALVAFILAMVSGTSLYFWWRQKKAKYETESIKANLQQQVLSKQVDFLSKYANDAILLMDEAGVIVEANDRAETMYGYTHDELIGMKMLQLRAPDDSFDEARFHQAVVEQKNMLVESNHQRRDGTVFPVEVSMGLIQTDQGIFAQSIVRDISERRLSENALRASETRLSMLFNNMINGFALHEVIRNPEGKIVDYRYLEVNPAFEKITRMKRSTLIGKTVKEIMPNIEDSWIDNFAEVTITGEPKHIEGYASALGGWYSVYAYRPAPEQFAVLVEDITTRKKAEERAHRLMNLYHALSETNDAIVRLKDKDSLFPLACRIAVEFGGMILAWVGIPDENKQFIVPIVSYGKVASYLDDIKIMLSADESEGQGPTAITFREARTVVVNDFDLENLTAPWHDRARKYGIRASATFPVMRGGKPYAVFTVYSDQSNSFDEEFVMLLNEISTNLGFVIDNFDRETLRRQAEVALRQSEARLRRVADEAPFPMMVYGEGGEILQVNRAWTDITGYSASEIPTIKAWVEKAYGSEAKEAEERVQRSFDIQDRFVSGERTIRCKDGSFRIWHFISSPLGRLPDERRFVITMATDITESRKAEGELRLAATVFESSHSSIVITDEQANIVAVNPAFTMTTGYSEEEVIGRNPRMLQSGRQNKEFYQTFWSALMQGDRWQGEIWNRRKSGEDYAAWLSVSVMRNESGVIKHYIGIADDITESKETQRKVEYLAYHDALTGLPNRMLASDRLEQSLVHASRSKSRVAVMFLDLDDFKTINDTLGHSVGDAMLKAVADRLRQCVRESDTVCRLGGDEFLVMLNDVAEIEAINRVALNMLDMVNRTYSIAEHNLTISTSIGIAVYPEDGRDRDTLLKNADMAMYNAKQSGRNTHRFFAEEMNDYVLEHLLIRNGLSRALENKEFLLHYQPLLDFSTGKLVGAEALIRWQHPELGLVPPSRFIPVAEDSGMIVPIGNWVLKEACRQAMEWHQSGWQDMVVAVNISAVQFRRGDIEQVVSGALTESGLDSKFLELELTESILIQDTDKTLDVLKRLGQLGVHLSIDDFGTGYSSLAYLRRLPVDKLKIDKSFVTEITSREDDAAIALSIITLAHSLKKKVIAEGVETVEQLRFLRQHQCDEMQGFLFSRPLPADVFDEFLKNGARPDFLNQNG